MNQIKSARIFGVLQDWDINDNRFDIERVNIEVPTFLLEAFTDDEIDSMCDEGTFGNDGLPLSLLVYDLIELDYWHPLSRWAHEDPCELKLEINYEEEA